MTGQQEKEGLGLTVQLVGLAPSELTVTFSLVSASSCVDHLTSVRYHQSLAGKLAGTKVIEVWSDHDHVMIQQLVKWEGPHRKVVFLQCLRVVLAVTACSSLKPSLWF